MANFSGGLQGGLGGAAAGATLGSIFPGIGTVIGAGGGGLLGLLAGLFGGGNEGGVQQADTLSPEQKGILGLLLNQGLGEMQNPYGGFEDLQNYTNENFKKNILPSISERFSSLGNNSLSSPAFSSQVGQAAGQQNYLSSLLRHQYGQQGRQNALGTLALGLQPSFQNYYKASQPGAGENILSGVLQAAPSVYQSYQLSNALQNLQQR